MQRGGIKGEKGGSSRDRCSFLPPSNSPLPRPIVPSASVMQVEVERGKLEIEGLSMAGRQHPHCPTSAASLPAAPLVQVEVERGKLERGKLSKELAAQKMLKDRQGGKGVKLSERVAQKRRWSSRDESPKTKPLTPTLRLCFQGQRQGCRGPGQAAHHDPGPAGVCGCGG